jgi:ABC-2 type transport system permease protein
LEELGGRAMQVFRTYYKILKTQAVPVLIYAALFFGMLTMSMNNRSGEGGQFEARKVSAMIINKEGENDLMKGFLDYLGNYVKYVEPKEEEQAIQDALYYREVSYILTIPEGFIDSFYREGGLGLRKQTAPDSMEAITIDTAINNYFNMARIYQKYLPGITAQQLHSYVKAYLEQQTRVSLGKENENAVLVGNSHNRFYFNSLGYIIIAVFIVSVSTVMLSFHGVDIRRRHFASPVTVRSLNMQLILANLAFVLIYLAAFIVVGYLTNHNRMLNINTFLFWLNAAAFALVALSISYLVGISVKSTKAVTALSTALSLGMAFLSGMFVPQEYLGEPVLKVASFTPAYWYVKANGAIETLTSSAWAQLSAIFSYMAIQFGFAAAIISVALVVSKRKRQQAG